MCFKGIMCLWWWLSLFFVRQNQPAYCQTSNIKRGLPPTVSPIWSFGFIKSILWIIKHSCQVWWVIGVPQWELGEPRPGGTPMKSHRCCLGSHMGGTWEVLTVLPWKRNSGCFSCTVVQLLSTWSLFGSDATVASVLGEKLCGPCLFRFSPSPPPSQMDS